MSERSRFGVLCLLAVVPVIVTGCGREGRLPNVVAPQDIPEATAPRLDAHDEPTLETMHGRGHHHLPPRVLIAEAKEGLGAVLTAEQAYFQKWARFTDMPDTADFGLVLGVHLGELLRRWSFSVSDASATGFVAKAQGRDGTEADRLTVILNYQRDQPLAWTIQRRRPRR